MYHTETTIEREHIERALAASQASMDAISTVTSIASYTLTILGIIIALLAIWGIKEIWERAERAAERIANKKLTTYITSNEFSVFVKNRIDKAVEARWQEMQIGSMEQEEVVADGGDSPFPSPPEKIQ
jgi:hypothetical protein